MKTRGAPPPIVTPATSPAFVAMSGATSADHFVGGLPHARAHSLVVVAGLDEPGEQRMRPQRLRLELGVELNGNEPGMVRQLDHLDELAVERASHDLQPV